MWLFDAVARWIGGRAATLSGGRTPDRFLVTEDAPDKTAEEPTATEPVSDPAAASEEPSVDRDLPETSEPVAAAEEPAPAEPAPAAEPITEASPAAEAE